MHASRNMNAYVTKIMPLFESVNYPISNCACPFISQKKTSSASSNQPRRRPPAARGEGAEGAFGCNQTNTNVKLSK